MYGSGVRIYTWQGCEFIHGKSCYWNGKYYKETERIPQGDGCNWCQCSNGDVGACTEVECEFIHGKSCYWNGKYYKEGRIPYGDGCNYCSCNNGDVGACSEAECLPSSGRNR